MIPRISIIKQQFLRKIQGAWGVNSDLHFVWEPGIITEIRAIRVFPESLNNARFTTPDRLISVLFAVSQVPAAAEIGCALAGHHRIPRRMASQRKLPCRALWRCPYSMQAAGTPRRRPSRFFSKNPSEKNFEPRWAGYIRSKPIVLHITRSGI